MIFWIFSWIVIIVMVFCISAMLWSTIRKKGRWGINLKSLTNSIQCPSCKNMISGLRKPRDLHELLWGGVACASCGSKLDKWGKLRKK